MRPLARSVHCDPLPSDLSKLEDLCARPADRVTKMLPQEEWLAVRGIRTCLPDLDGAACDTGIIT